MTWQNQIKIWVGVLLASILLLWVFRGIILPFVVGLTLAYILNPLVGMVQKLGVNRAWATAIVLGAVLLALTGVLFLIVPLLTQQIVGLAYRLPGYVIDLQALANNWVPALNEWLGPDRTQQLEKSITDFSNALNIATFVTSSLAQSGLTLLSTLALAVVTAVVAFYLLLDWESMVRGLDNLLPRDYQTEIRGVLHEIDRSMAAVVRGQGSVVLVLCFYYATALSVTGLSFGLAIGLMAGLLSFVPFVGFLTGFVLSMIIALVQFWPNWWMVLAVFMVFMVGQFLEGNILYPKLVGSSIGINPVWLMFSLFAFALLFGYVGLLLAVPLSAITAVLTRYMIRKYKQSTLYRGQNGEQGVDSTIAD
jgi:predicted PurR-regulated permease PerM